MTASTPALAPVAAAERIQAMDVLRGFALLGILLMNIEAFAGPMMAAITGLDPALTGVDRWADGLIYFFVQGKFYTLFSLLFGMGFAVMMARARAAGRPFAVVYLRRTLALLAIGLAHALLVWPGDILVSYALVALFLLFMVVANGLGLARWGLFGAVLSVAIVAAAVLGGSPMSALALLPLWGLLMMARLPREGLAAYAVLLILFVPLMMFCIGLLGMAAQATPESAAEWNASMAAQGEHVADLVARERLVFGTGTYAEATALRIELLDVMLGYVPVWGWQILGLFLLGAWFVKRGVISAPERHARLYTRLRWIALPAGMAMMLASFLVMPTIDPGRMDLAAGSAQALSMAGGTLMCLGYVAWFVRALDTPSGAAIGAWLAPAGRMALSNYLAQSVVCTLVFYGYGLGWFGQLPRAWQVPFVLVLFGLQLLLSRWWMARFRFGPMEWLWRAATYLQLPPMRLARGGVPVAG